MILHGFAWCFFHCPNGQKYESKWESQKICAEESQLMVKWWLGLVVWDSRDTPK